MIPFLYDFIYIIPLSLATMIFGYMFSGQVEPGASRYVVSLIATAIFVCLRQMENRGRVILSGTVTMVLAGVILVQKSEERAEFLLNNRWILQIVILSLAAFLAGQLMTAFRRARLGMAVALAGVLCFTMVQEFKPPSVGVACLLFVLLLVYAEEIQLRWKKSGETDGKKYTLQRNSG